MNGLKGKGLSIIFLFVILVLAACNSDEDALSNEEENEESIYAVEVDKVEKGTLSTEYRLTGTVMAEKIAPVIPMLTGEATKVHVKNGDVVKEGDVIIEMDASDIELNVQQAKAGLEAAEANLRSVKAMREQGIKQAEMQVEQAEKAYEMISNASIDDTVNFEDIPEELHEVFQKIMMSNMPTEQDIAQAEIAVKQAKMALEQAKRTEQVEAAEASVKQANIAVKMAEKQQKNAKITAPVSGEVTNLTVATGDFVSPQLPLMQIVNMDEPIVNINVNEMMLSHFNEEQTVDVYIPSLKKTLEGIVTYIGLLPAEQSRAYPVEIKLKTKNERLKVGMVAEIIMENELTNEQVIVPVKAVTEENGEMVVYVTKDGKTVERRVITIGNETADHFEIVSGLSEGEYIIVNGQHQLYDGAKINVRNEDNFNFSN